MSHDQIQPAATPAIFTPAEIVGKISAWGCAKAALSFNRLMGLGLLAGLFIGIGATLCLLVISDSALGLGPTRLIGGAVFSLGLMLVVLTGAELSTGNCLMVIPWAAGKLPGAAMLRNWGCSFLANCFGAVLLAGLVAKSGLFDGGDLQQAAKNVAGAKFALDPAQAFVRGVLCNMLVCLAVWMSFACTTAPGKMIAVMLPIAAFVALGFEHSVANAFLLPLGLYSGAPGSFEQIAANLAVVTAGNLFGGAAIGWALGTLHGGAAVPPAERNWRPQLAAVGTAAVKLLVPPPVSAFTNEKIAPPKQPQRQSRSRKR